MIKYLQKKQKMYSEIYFSNKNFKQDKITNKNESNNKIIDNCRFNLR